MLVKLKLCHQMLIKVPEEFKYVLCRAEFPLLDAVNLMDNSKKDILHLLMSEFF